MRTLDAARRSDHCVIALTLLMLVPGLFASGCRYGSEAQCQNEPLGSVTVWVEDHDAFKPMQFSGSVKALLPEKAGFDGATIVDEDGGERVIRFRVPETDPPVELGHFYGFEIQYVGGWPAASSILIRDDAGLLFAGVSDWDLGSNVVKGGVPGFEVEKITSDCRSRPHGSCYDELRNAVLRVTAGKESVALFHGESARLGPYEVTCLTCQDVLYNDSCADAGLISISYTIARIPAKPAE